MTTNVQLQAVVDHVLQRPSKSKSTYAFAFDDFLRREYRFGLDPDRPLCKAFMQGHCPLGNKCPDKHVASASYNKYVHVLHSCGCLGALNPPHMTYSPSP